MNKKELSLLVELLHQPTAPFREQRVIEFISGVLRDHRVPYFEDPIGNIVVGCRSVADYRRLVNAHTEEPLRVYIAHMDHPGFHGVRWLGDKRLQVQWHGGGPTKHLSGANVWLTDGNEMYEGRMQSARLIRGGHTIDTAKVQLNKTISKKAPPKSFSGGFSFRAPVWRSGDKLHTQVADDLVGVFAIISTAIAAMRSANRRPFLGLLTRAEEVGFIGAIGHFDLGWLTAARRPVLCISLETSRTLPNAIIGKGPVVRLGDRRTVFDASALNVLTQIARDVLPDRHQRRIMDGGTCEATAATVYGLPAIGISIPLGNYHNQGLEGGPDCRGRNGPAPEFVHLDDIDGMLALCRGLLQPNLPWKTPWKDERRLYKKRLKRYQPLL